MSKQYWTFTAVSDSSTIRMREQLRTQFYYLPRNRSVRNAITPEEGTPRRADSPFKGGGAYFHGTEWRWLFFFYAFLQPYAFYPGPPCDESSSQWH